MSQPPTPRKRVKENNYDPELKARFMDRLKSMNIATDKNQCWIWKGFTVTFGYGIMKYEYGTYRTHRIAWETFIGVIPKGKYVLHQCRNYGCCNPAHLFLGDQSENMTYQHKQDKMNIASGEAAGQSKLTKDQVEKIRKLWNSGNYYQYQLGEMFGVSQPQICRILNKTYWR